jgi:Ca2+-binding RTX toxin-like protein
VSLDGQPNDGDPKIDPPDTATNGEGDNIASDVEDVIGTKREDRLIGSDLGNVLTGGEGVDTLVGNAGEDTLEAREPISAGSGLRDVLSCGSPSPFTKGSLGLLGIIATVSGTDRLEADLADVKPADCEELVDMAVDEPAPVTIARSVRRVRGGNLAARLTCPRAAHRTCRGTLRLAGKHQGSRAASFVLGRGVTRNVRLRLKPAAKAAIRHGHPHVRLVSRERGLKGRIERIALVRVR